MATVTLVGGMACTVRPAPPKPPVPAEVVQRVDAALIGSWAGTMTVSGWGENAVTMVFAEGNRVTLDSTAVAATGSWTVTGEGTFALHLSAQMQGDLAGRVTSTQQGVLDETARAFTAPGDGDYEGTLGRFRARTSISAAKT